MCLSAEKSTPFQYVIRVWPGTPPSVVKKTPVGAPLQAVSTRRISEYVLKWRSFSGGEWERGRSIPSNCNKSQCFGGADGDEPVPPHRPRAARPAAGTVPPPAPTHAGKRCRKRDIPGRPTNMHEEHAGQRAARCWSAQGSASFSPFFGMTLGWMGETTPPSSIHLHL